MASTRCGGTGWNAALLAELAGAENVTTMEIDPHVAEQARRHLDAAGYPVRVIAEDRRMLRETDLPLDAVAARTGGAQLRPCSTRSMRSSRSWPYPVAAQGLCSGSAS